MGSGRIGGMMDGCARTDIGVSDADAEKAERAEERRLEMEFRWDATRKKIGDIVCPGLDDAKAAARARVESDNNRSIAMANARAERDKRDRLREMKRDGVALRSDADREISKRRAMIRAGELEPERNLIDVRTSYVEAFFRLGGTKGMVDWARKNDRNLGYFYRIVSGLLPKELTVTGKGGFNLVIERAGGMDQPETQQVIEIKNGTEQ